MVVCSSCGAENREGARFCDSCGAPLTEAAPEHVAQLADLIAEGRKVLTAYGIETLA